MLQNVDNWEIRVVLKFLDEVILTIDFSSPFAFYHNLLDQPIL